MNTRSGCSFIYFIYLLIHLVPSKFSLNIDIFNINIFIYLVFIYFIYLLIYLASKSLKILIFKLFGRSEARLEKLQRSGVQLSERTASLGNHGSPIQVIPETPPTSQHHDIEELKGGPHLFPH